MTPTPPQKPQRFVPTLTEVISPDEVERLRSRKEVVTLPPAMAVPAPPPLPEPAAPAPTDAAVLDPYALAQQVRSSVMASLNDHIRQQVADIMQAQQMLMIQTLRMQLTPLVESWVVQALDAHLGEASDRPFDARLHSDN
jgi:hypothetical protein